ncbi:hypothetical protein BHE74_00058338, partial [Ensete ventricosum]
MLMFALPSGKAPYRAVYTGFLVVWYADRPLSGDIVEIDDSRLREKEEAGEEEKGEEEEGETCSLRAALPRFSRAIRRPRDLSLVGKESPARSVTRRRFFTGGRFFSSRGEKNYVAVSSPRPGRRTRR